MVKHMQTGYTATSTNYNQLNIGTERVSKEDKSNRHRNSTRRRNNNGVTITFNRNLPEGGAVLGNMGKTYKESFRILK